MSLLYYVCQYRQEERILFSPLRVVPRRYCTLCAYTLLLDFYLELFILFFLSIESFVRKNLEYSCYFLTFFFYFSRTARIIEETEGVKYIIRKLYCIYFFYVYIVYHYRK